LNAALGGGEANKSFEQVGGGGGASMNSRAPARMALTMIWGWLRLPMAKTAESGSSWRSSSMARMATA
jgi:hypothetical protein